MKNERIYNMAFASVYPHYIAKAEKKGRTKEEVDEIIFWLTGYDLDHLNELIKNKVSFKYFFENTPNFNLNASKIKGVICGYRVEEIKDSLLQKIQYLDKLIDELAKGISMDKIKRC